jgi:hypothetical protein
MAQRRIKRLELRLREINRQRFLLLTEARKVQKQYDDEREALSNL